MSEPAADRIRTLLLRGDNLLKRADRDRGDGAREAFLAARELARTAGVDPRLGELVERRLAALDTLRSDGPAAG